MFTGIIHGQGEVLSIEQRGNESRFRIKALYALEDIVTGESIATNGVCLTVETHGKGWFTAYASGETMRVTTLGALRPGMHVNLERALAVGDRLGGHIVSGHVDCIAKVNSIARAGASQCFRLSFPEEFATQVIPKGSVALDGISLTVNHCGANFLEVNIIPETQHVTTIANWTKGRHVNMETDMIGKYVQRMLSPWTQQSETAGSSHKNTSLTIDFLKEHGF